MTTASEQILLDPPDWSKLTSIEISVFAETVNTLLDYGIFRPALAAELVGYRDAANTEMGRRVASGARA